MRINQPLQPAKSKRTLESRGALATPNGHIAVGCLVVEDLVLVLVLLPALAGLLGEGTAAKPEGNLLATLALTIIVLMLVVGRRFFPGLLWQARTGSRELFSLRGGSRARHRLRLRRCSAWHLHWAPFSPGW